MSDIALLHEYLDGKSNYRRTRDFLNRTTADGMIWAGEIAIEQAHKTRNFEFLGEAKNSFERAIGRMAISTVSYDKMAKVKIHQAHLPIHGLMVLHDELPPTELAKNVYQKTISIANLLLQKQCELRALNPDYIDSNIKGTLGELAVLSLLERIATKDIGSETWFPLIAHVGQDRKNRPGSTVNHGWDISVFSDINGIDEVENKLQVKCAHHMDIDRINEDGITLIEIDPDLRLLNTEGNIANIIIRECYQEIFIPNSSLIISKNLDDRSELLLDKLV